MPTLSVAVRANPPTVFDVLLAPLLMLMVGLLGAVVSVSTVVVLLFPVKIVPSRSLLESEMSPFLMLVSKSLSMSTEQEACRNKIISISLLSLILYSKLFNNSFLPNKTNSK